MRVDKQGESCAVIVDGGEVKIQSVADALDLMATVSHVYECQKMIVPKECFAEDFFDLKTGFAGEVLQKYTNYGMRIVIVGDFSGYESKSLRDFIRESNKGKQVNFLPDEQQALASLHR